MAASTDPTTAPGRENNPGLHRRLGDKVVEGVPSTTDEPQPDEDNRSILEKHDDDEDGKHKKKKKPKVLTRSGAVMSSVCHVLTTGLTVYFAYLSFKSHSLFSWHPSSAAIGALVLGAHGILVMWHDNILTRGISRKMRVRLHWIILLLASAFMLAGFVAIVIDKNHRGKHHLTSIHAIVGILSMGLMTVSNLNGWAALYAKRLKQFVKPSWVKQGHCVSGIVTFAVCIVCLVSGLYTNFFKREGGFSSQVLCIAILALVCVLTLLKPVVSVYGRFKNLSRR